MAKAYGSIITNIGTSQVTNAMLEGRKVNITHIAVGDGNGIEYMPTPDMTRLKREVWRGAITDYSKDADQVIDIYGIIPASVGNFIIREMAAIDSDGNAIVLTNSPPIPKITMDTGASLDLNIRIKIVVTNADVLEFKIDPNVTTASMAKVIVKADKVIGATAGNLAKLNELGNLVDAGVSWEEIEAWFTSLKEKKAQSLLGVCESPTPDFFSWLNQFKISGTVRLDNPGHSINNAPPTGTRFEGYLNYITDNDASLLVTSIDNKTIWSVTRSSGLWGKWKLMSGYESGTWPIVIYGAINEGNPEYIVKTGTWEKIGSHMFINGSIRLTTIGGMTGPLRVRGVPEPAKNPVRYVPCYGFGFKEEFSDLMLTAAITSYGFIELNIGNLTDAFDNARAESFGSGGDYRVYFSLNYEV